MTNDPDLHYTEALDDAFPREISPPIKCSLRGYEKVRISYVVSTSKAEIQKQNNDDELAALVVDRVWDWPFEHICPKPLGGKENAAMWAPIPMHLKIWIVRDGYQQGLQESISPNSGNG